ncbi:MAG: type IV pilus biogenesis/stability protein PilW [Sulfuriferula sp.]
MNKMNFFYAFLLAITMLGGCTTTTIPSESNQLNAASRQANKEERARIHTELGAGYYSRGQYEIALDELREALKTNDEYAPAYDIMGLVYMALNEDKLAEKNFLHAIDLSPHDSDIHNNYGWFLCNRNHFNESIQQFDTALSNPLYSKPESALTNAGICSLKANRPNSAKTYFEAALKSSPDQAQALSGLAQIDYQEGLFVEAQTLIERLLEYNQPTAQALWIGLRVARKLNDHDTEASYRLLMRNRFPDAPETQLLLQGKYD